MFFVYFLKLKLVLSVPKTIIFSGDTWTPKAMLGLKRLGAQISAKSREVLGRPARRSLKAATGSNPLGATSSGQPRRTPAYRQPYDDSTEIPERPKRKL